MNRVSRWFAITGTVLALGAAAPVAFALATPTLSLTAVGDGNGVNVSVTGEPTVSVTLYFTLPDMITHQQPLGSTDAQGKLDKTVSSNSYALTPGTIVYVVLKGTSGPEMQSSYIAWPQLGVASTNTTTTTNTQSNTVGTTLSQTSVTVPMGGDTTFTVAGSGTPYSVFTASDGIAAASITGMTITVYGMNVGSSKGSVCAATGQCTPFAIVVSNSAPAPVVTPVASTVSVPVVTTSASSFYFTSALGLGSSGPEVTALQSLLVSLGYLTASPNGNFGPQTQSAVIKFQAAHGLSSVGTVGPGTRAALNQLSSGSSGASASVATSVAAGLSTPIANMSVAELRTLVGSLVTQLAQIATRLAALGG